MDRTWFAQFRHDTHLELTMGYTPQRKKYNLEFDKEFEGLEISLYGLSIGELVEIQKLRMTAEEGSEGTETMLQHLVDHIVSWNVTTDTGVAVKPTVQSVSAMDTDLVMAMISAWLNAIIGVSVPLESSSTDGQPSLVGSIPTATLSQSQAS